MTNVSMTNRPALSDEQIRKQCPSVFAEHPAEGASARYTFVPTHKVIKEMGDIGWEVVEAKQQFSRKRPDRAEFAPHMVRLRHKEQGLIEVGGSHIEAIIINSHDRTKRLRLLGGVFKWVCTNGLAVGEHMFPEQEITHIDRASGELIAAACALIGRLGMIKDSIDHMRKRPLKADERTDFAARALAMRYPSDLAVPPIQADQLLETRRNEDVSHDLWTTFNVIQENIIRGGIKGLTKIPVGQDQFVERWVTTQPITNIQRNIEINRALWDIAGTYIQN